MSCIILRVGLVQMGDKRKDRLEIPSKSSPAEMARAFLEQTLGQGISKKQKQ